MNIIIASNEQVTYKDIPFLVGYRIGIDGSFWSSWGRGRRTPSGIWTQLKPTPNSKGYLQVCIRGKAYKIHTLVLTVFVGPKPVGMECRHKDSNKLNNCKDNLEWATPKENTKDKIAISTHYYFTGDNARKGEMNSQAKLTKEDVIKIRKLRKDGLTCKQIGEMFNVTGSLISCIDRRKAWAHV